MFTELSGNKAIAEQFLLRSLEICAHDHHLSSRILDVVSKTPGRMQIVFRDWIDPNAADQFSVVPKAAPSVVHRDNANPSVEMGRFIVDYHRHVAEALTVAEDWAADSSTPIPQFPGLSAEDRARFSLPAEDRVLTFGRSDFYNCVSGRDVSLDDAESLVRPGAKWQTHLCTTCAAVPTWGSSVDQAFVDGLVANLRHVFVPCFDTSGYLIWTPA